MCSSDLSAVLLAFAIPNEFWLAGSSVLGLGALVPLYVGFLLSPAKKHVACSYGLFVALVHACSSFWLKNFQGFALFTLGASTVGYFFYALPFGVAFACILRKQAPARACAFALVWTLWEWVKSTGILAYPWGTVPMTAHSLSHLIQIADITGVWGLSFLIPLANACVAESLHFFIKKRDSVPVFRLWLLTGCLYCLCSLYGAYRIATLGAPRTTLALAIVQQNADPWDTTSFEKNLTTAIHLTETALRTQTAPPLPTTPYRKEKTLTHASARAPVDMVVWSESSLRYPYEQYRHVYNALPAARPFSAFLRTLGAPLLVGTPLRLSGNSTKGGYANAVALLRPDGHVAQVYGKMQMVPFAEFIPWGHMTSVQRLAQMLAGFSESWTPGPGPRLFHVPCAAGGSVRFATPICYEDAFPSLCAALHTQGSELLINLTNDSWSKTASAEWQHYVVSLFRAIELRTTLVRSTNSGYTVVIGPEGKTRAAFPLFQATSAVLHVPVYPVVRTYYARMRDWVIVLCALIFFAEGVRMAVHTRRHSTTQAESSLQQIRGEHV